MSDVVQAMTERLLADAGIGAGMSVLDAGCGRGDVALVLAAMVGDRGRVLGVDRDEAPLAKGRMRAEELLFPNLTYRAGDLDAVDLPAESFDVVFGRRVLMYLPDPAATLRRLARALRPGGLMVFQEHDATMGPIRLVPWPLHERIQGYVWETVRREGANLHMGLDLPVALRAAGLLVEHVRAEGVVQAPEIPHAIGTIARLMLPRIVRQGVATAEEVDIDTLDARLAEERRQATATLVGDLVFGAWARKPG